MSVNWGKLYLQGRCYAVGVPWNPDQAYAAHNLGIPAQYVRRGCLSLDDHKALQKEDADYEKRTGEKPLEVQSRDELLIKIGEKGIEVTPAAPDNVLVELLTKDKPKEKVTVKSETPKKVTKKS